MALSHSPAHDSGEPLIHSISGGADRCASPSAVLRLIGQSTGHFPAKRRPSDTDRRTAATVAAALGEVIREQWDAQDEPWRTEVPESLADLARRAGASENEVTAALRLLADADVLAAVMVGGQRRLRLCEEAFEEAPALARMDGDVVRDRLDAVRASVAPALAVLRELALASRGVRDVGQPGPWIQASLARLSEATFFKRTSVSKALSELEAARLVERSARSGKQHSYRLLPSVFGGDVPELSGALPTDDSRGDGSLAAPGTAATRDPAADLAASGVIVEIGSTRIRVGAGLECSVSLDPSGIPLLRVERSR